MMVNQDGQYAVALVEYFGGYKSGRKEVSEVTPETKDEHNELFSRYVYKFQSSVESIMFVAKCQYQGYIYCV